MRFSLLRKALTAALIFCATHAADGRVFAQSQNHSPNAPRISEENLEFQLHLIVASNASAEVTKLPSSLDPIAKQLRTAMQLGNYRLGATFLNRVADGHSLEVKGVGTAQLAALTSNASSTPTFYDFSFSQIRLSTDAAGRKVVQTERFRFGMRIPIHLSTVRSADGNAAAPVTQYESVGLTTGVSVPIDEPTVIGTLTVGRPDETLVLVLVPRKVSSR